MKPVRIRATGLLVRDNQLLLVNHQKQGKSYYLLPGGGVDGNETVQEALHRELLEELGIEVEVGSLLLAAQTVSPNRDRNILHLVHRVYSEQEPKFTGNDQRVTGFYWYCMNQKEEILFYPDILPSILELTENPSYNGIELKLPEWLD